MKHLLVVEEDADSLGDHFVVHAHHHVAAGRAAGRVRIRSITIPRMQDANIRLNLRRKHQIEIHQ